MRVLIKVTKEVLERSKMCSIYGANKNCMVAVAIIDLFPNANVWNRTANLLGLTSFESLDRVILPDYVKNAINMFDCLSPEERLLIEPFSFEIEVPEYVISKIGIGEIYRVLSESKSLELVMPKETNI